MEPLPIADLFSRRSIRRYTDETVSPEHVERLLQAAMAAPSAANRCPWHFCVVTDEAIKRALSEATPYASMVARAPLCVVPCGQPSLSIPGRTDYWIQDLSAATENILLAATGLGLGAVWCGVYPIEERVRVVREILGVPDDVVPFCFVALGHPAEEHPARTQYDASRVHHERW